MRHRLKRRRTPRVRRKKEGEKHEKDEEEKVGDDEFESEGEVEERVEEIDWGEKIIVLIVYYTVGF